MALPFSTADFLGVFARYNHAVWPMQIVLYALAAAVVVLALRPGARQSRIAGTLLAALWAWTGIAYHALFFTRLNPAAYGFAAVFVLQAAFFAAFGWSGRLRLRAGGDAGGIAGGALVTYALVAYPLLVAATGHPYPAAPTFGAPCPVTLFTLGVLAWADRRLPPVLLVIPVLWSLTGTMAAAALGMTPDYALVPASVVAIAVLLIRARGRATTPARAPASAATA
jgi:hypothetical protein